MSLRAAIASNGRRGRLRASSLRLAGGPIIVTPEVLTYGANIAIDAGAGAAFQVTLTGATAQLDNPDNMVEGMQFVVEVIQDGTGGRALTFDTAWDFGASGTPTLSTLAAGKRARISCVAKSSSKVDCVYAGNFGA